MLREIWHGVYIWDSYRRLYKDRGKYEKIAECFTYDKEPAPV